MTRKQQHPNETIVINYWIAERKNRKTFKVRERNGRRGFTLHREGECRWMLDGKHCESGSRAREQFAAGNLEEAVDYSVRFLFKEVITEKEPESEHPHLSLIDAFAFAIPLSNGQPEHIENLTRYADYFIDWAEKRQLLLWEEIRQSHIRMYISHMQKTGRTHKTILNYIEPIRFAAKRIAAEHPDFYRDASAGLIVRNEVGSDGIYRGTEGTQSLTFAEILELFRFVHGQPHEREIRVGLLLGGFMGLRMREWIFLSWKSVNLTEDTLIVQKEEGHRPKNRYSVRCLPLPKFVADYLTSLPRSGPRVIGDGLAPKGVADRDVHLTRLANTTCQQVLRAIREWRSDSTLSGKDLRNTLHTFAIENADRVNTRLFDRFCGHAPTGMMDRHYHGRVKDDLVTIYREKVIPFIDVEIETTLVAGERYKMARNGTTEGASASPSQCQVVDLSGLAS